MADIRFSGVKKIFDNGVVALDTFTLDIESPTLVVLVGPSGCGKTTLLRLIAGLERPTEGSITLGSERLDTLDPRARDVAMVFQNYALYPHMTVRENLSFGLQIRKVSKDVIRKRAEEVAKELEIGELLERRPAQLSGGQRQRVALGRAIIREPRVFLFDEPLSNLDARLRDEMRYMIKRLYQRLRTTTVYVTHDQVEAMTIGEMLVVLREGKVHQVGSPEQCYHHPQDAFVASFIGSPPMNLFEGTYNENGRSIVLRQGIEVGLPERMWGLARTISDKEIILGARPEHCRFTAGDEGESLQFEGRMVLKEPLGHETLTHVDVAGEKVIIRGEDPGGVATDGAISFGVKPEAVHFFSRRSGQRIDVAGAVQADVRYEISDRGSP